MVEERNFWENAKLRDRLIATIKSSKKAQDALDGDGHSIYSAEWLIDAGFPADFVKKYETTLKSDYSSGKTTIFDYQGNPVDELVGIAALSFHYAVANALWLEAGVDYNDTLSGRGFQAQELSRAIMKSIGINNG